eukprot:m51a1_g3318 putative myosin light chain (308) ;mRNA; f:349478-350949
MSLTGYRIVSRNGTQYTLNRLAGKGAFSLVYESCRDDDGKIVAIKVIEKRKVQGKSLQNLLREIEIMRTVSHPNVMSLEDLLETDSYLFIITQFMHGGELFERIVARGHLTEEDARGIVSQILCGINYLHSIGVCHRDLKPENLLCTSQEEGFTVVISDFGFSKLFGRGELMKTGCGTLHYAAPEVFQGRAYTEACDMWAVGVITYVILTGCFPFDGPARQLGEKILHADYCRGNLDAIHVSEPARDFIARLLVVQADKRLTAAQCLQHPWVTGECPSTANAEGSNRQRNLRQSVDNLSTVIKRTAV